MEFYDQKIAVIFAKEIFQNLLYELEKVKF